MSPRVLGWGLLGTARINRVIIPPLRTSARNRLVAVASRSRERADRYASEWGIGRAHGSYEALLADPGVDVVYIPLPNALHAPWTIRAVESGKHVLCEKPLATTVADVLAIEEAARHHGRVVAEAFMYRHHPLTTAVVQAVASGVIGDLRLIRGSFTFKHEREPDVRWDPALGGGSLWDVGCYPVGYARLVAGVEPADVIGWQHATPAGVDEAFVGLLRFPGHLHAMIDCSFRTPFRTRVELVGTEGTIVVPNPFKPGADSSYDLETAGGTRLVACGSQELYSGEIEDLASAVLEGTATRVTLADSRANVAVLAALHESARSGQRVTPAHGLLE
jgi:predicted dehydrogenase